MLQHPTGMHIIMLELRTNGMHQDCFMQQVKLPLFIKHAIPISIVGLSLGVTSMFKKLILLYHYCLRTLNMLQ